MSAIRVRLRQLVDWSAAVWAGLPWRFEFHLLNDPNMVNAFALPGGASQPEFFSTHPNPENRIEQIEEAIREEFPDDVPDGLTP